LNQSASPDISRTLRPEPHSARGRAKSFVKGRRQNGAQQIAAGKWLKYPGWNRKSNWMDAQVMSGRGCQVHCYCISGDLFRNFFDPWRICGEQEVK